jgi:hypothetical protein
MAMQISHPKCKMGGVGGASAPHGGVFVGRPPQKHPHIIRFEELRVPDQGIRNRPDLPLRNRNR